MTEQLNITWAVAKSEIHCSTPGICTNYYKLYYAITNYYINSWQVLYADIPTRL